MLPDDSLSVSEFIDLVNQTFELAYPIINIIGELANFKISKNKWVYFDLKDEDSTLRFFGTVYSLKQPLEDGMMIKVTCNPRMHHTYGFSMQVQNIKLVGEGSIKRAAELLQVKLSREGLFDVDKKRPIPYPPTSVALITSGQSAAYHDFVKIINNRWRGVNIDLFDVQVQGELAVSQITQAIKLVGASKSRYDVLVVVRGGGSPEDLAAFSSENVTRAVASSRIPTLVAIGHEIDISLAELAADRRASTPSHAAEQLVPDRRAILSNLKQNKVYLNKRINEHIKTSLVSLELISESVFIVARDRVGEKITKLSHQIELLKAYDPKLVLERGYSIVRRDGRVLRSSENLSINDLLGIHFAKGSVISQVEKINKEV